MLFSFNDEFIAAMCGGLNDDDTLELLVGGIDAMIGEVETAIERTTGTTKKVSFDGDVIFVDLNQEEADAEFGAAGVMMQPAYRQAFAQSAHMAALAFDRRVNADA